ncbi:MAG: hypothetical protein LBC02_10815 [Planctomycetaceae bacterium]|nr:hypothetical protein [Planctomycetaceae bacterium]
MIGFRLVGLNGIVILFTLHSMPETNRIRELSKVRKLLPDCNSIRLQPK